MPEVRADHELGMYRFLAEINAHLEKAGDAEGAARFALRASMHHFQAHEGALALLPAGRARAGVSFSIPRGGSWDEAALTDFLARRNPRLPGNVLMAGLRRRGRPWAVLALRRSGSDFERGLGRALARAASAVSAMIERIDRVR